MRRSYNLRRRNRRPILSVCMKLSLVAITLLVILNFSIPGIAFRSTSHSINTKDTPLAMATTTSTAILESRLRAALWGLFSGDALASPTHWYYGGARQIQGDYGRDGITTYTKPVTNLYGSILNKSNTNGGGRGSFTKRGGISIIGDVINHGKRPLWDPKKSIHYHATLQKGENTLEAQLVRVLMKSIVENDGKFSKKHFLQAYVAFMTTPDSHNDTYASTCHRMFFANRIFEKREWEDCPDNDEHNVDAIDALVFPTVVALASVASSMTTSNADVMEIKEKARSDSASCVSVTRRSDLMESVSMAWSDVVYDALTANDDEGMFQSLQTLMTNSLGIKRAPQRNGRDEMSACYISQSLPSAVDMIAKYSTSPDRKNDVWTGLIANANVGGENVHRGCILGAILGARAGMESIPKEKLVDGLYDKETLEQEIDDFVEAVLGKKRQE
mmetsp:Transcript_9153/g.13514  ORF Transcript_9153/g.13514 Transcript_9153/m.13514 type:complete len:445 (-) Transcript_9153:266-1600(-)